MLRTAKEIATAYSRKYKPTLFDDGIGSRLPKEYRKFYDEWRNTTPKPVHYIPEPENWKRNEKTGEVKRIENIPLPTISTKELETVFTGGEKIILGFLKRGSKYSPRYPRFWVPLCYRSAIYSEILDKYLAVNMTKRVVQLIHEHRSFDNYLLNTKACDLGTLIAIKLKKKLLEKLLKKDLPYDEEKNNLIYEKYKKYLMPAEELEWYGLTFTEACRKLQENEEAARIASTIPLKHLFRKELLEELKAKKEEDHKS